MFTRALIVLLLVLNLGVAAWSLLRPEAPAPAAPLQEEGVPRLQLLSEAPPQRVAPPTTLVPAEAMPAEAALAAEDLASAEASATPEPSAPERCFTAGPFTDAATATTARTVLQSRGASASERVEPGARGGTWAVALPPQADRATAQALGERIAAAGFTDYYVVADGAQANAIALGRFGNEAAANRHRDALQAVGFGAQVQPPPGAQARHWLDVRTSTEFDPQAARAALGAPLQPAACRTLR